MTASVTVMTTGLKTEPKLGTNAPRMGTLGVSLMKLLTPSQLKVRVFRGADGKFELSVKGPDDLVDIAQRILGL